MASCAVMDIEDYETPRQHLIKRNIRNTLKSQSNENGEDEVKLSELENSNIPGVGSIFLKTWGCSHNHSDAEYMAGQLAAYGYSITGKDTCVTMNYSVETVLLHFFVTK